MFCVGFWGGGGEEAGAGREQEKGKNGIGG